MKILPSGVEIPDEDLYIWEAYNFSCVAHPTRPAVCLHEEPPKSINPKWQSDPNSRFPVCNDCHELVHELGRQDAEFYLRAARSQYFPDALEDMEGYARQL